MRNSTPPLSAAQAAAQSGRPKRTILYAIATGALPAQKMPGYNGIYLIDPIDLDKWMAERSEQSA